MRDLRRIEPSDAEDLDAETETLLKRWAARKLEVGEEEVARVLIEVTGGCGEGTCEFTTARAEVDLTDGRVFLGPDQGFGLFISDVVEMDVNPDGTERRPGDMWSLYSEDGRKVAEKPQPEPQSEPQSVIGARAPEPGVSIRVTRHVVDRLGGGQEVASQRTEVFTSRGWMDLRSVVADYHARRMP